MTRVNILLLLILVGCALSVVTAQHQARALFVALQAEQEQERKLDNEWRELQIEAQTLGNGKRIEQKASQELGMRVPDAKKTVMVVLDNAAAPVGSSSSRPSPKGAGEK